MRLCFAMLSLLFCTGAWAGETGMVPSDEPLHKPVTLAVKGKSLADVMTLLAKQTGAKVRVRKDIADQKTSLFVDARPLKYVLDGLSTIFGYRWSIVKSGSGTIYELWEPEKGKLARRAAVEGALELSRQAFDSLMRQYVQLSATDPSKLRAMRDALLERRGRLTHEEVMQCELIDRVLHETWVGAGIAKLCLSLSPDAFTALRSGGRVYFDTDTSEAEWRIPDDMAKQFTARLVQNWRGVSGSRPSGHYNLRMNPLAASRGQLYFQPDLNVYAAQSGKLILSSSSQIGGSVTIPKLEPTDPQIRLPNSGNAEMLDKSVAFSARELVDECDLSGQTDRSSPTIVSRSDLLALLHRKLGVQIISDYYTDWLPCEPGKAHTVRQILDSLGNGTEPSADPKWGWDGECLYVRERFPYTKDAAEVPNRLLERWRHDYARQQCFDLDDTADIASLTNDQLTWAGGIYWERLIRVKGVKYTQACVFPNIAGSMRQFRFYGSLDEGQKRLACGNGLGTGSLSTLQADRLDGVMASMNEDWDRCDTEVRRVGVYNEYGIRIDKPDADTTMPVSVRIEKRQSRGYLLGLGDTYRYTVTASSPEDAWRKFLSKSSDGCRGPHYFARDVGYAMILAFQDGSTRELLMPLYEPIEDTSVGIHHGPQAHD